MTGVLKCAALLGLWLAATGCATRAPVRAGPVDYDWGPFAASWTDVHGNERQRVLGPIYDRTETPEGWEARAYRPVFHGWGHADKEVVRNEILWPLGAYRRRGASAYWRFLLTFRWNWDREDPDSRHRTWLFPFVFTGRSIEGREYFALFPLGGTVREFLFWDRIRFALFPLYVNSRINDVEARTWLWPFVSKTEGEGVRRFRVFPFYGYNEREGRGRKTFVLWPFWNQVRYTTPGASGFGWILFPIAGHLNLTNQETWWVIPPLFRVSVGEEQNRIFGPWPFFQRESGQTEKLYLWPLYGRKVIGHVDKRFFLWPLGQYEQIAREESTTTRTHLLPFYRRYVNEVPPGGGGEVEASDWTKVWPLYSHLSKDRGAVRKTVFPDLNPMRGGPIERNFAPFWQWYVRQEADGDVDTEVLWGLYRGVKRGEAYQYRSLFPLFSWSREEEGGHFSLFKGLLSRRREGEEKRWRVLYLFQFGGND